MKEEQLAELDWIVVTDPVEQVSMDMEVIDYASYEGKQYVLAIPAFDEEDEEEAEMQEDNDEAFIFELCEEEAAEFVITQDHVEGRLYVTTDMDEATFAAVAAVFENSDEYDLEVKENDDNND